jgi:hypothetical protein
MVEAHVKERDSVDIGHWLCVGAQWRGNDSRQRRYEETPTIHAANGTVGRRRESTTQHWTCRESRSSDRSRQQVSSPLPAGGPGVFRPYTLRAARHRTGPDIVCIGMATPRGNCLVTVAPEGLPAPVSTTSLRRADWRAGPARAVTDVVPLRAPRLIAGAVLAQVSRIDSE